MKLEMNRAWNDALRLLGVSRDVILVVAGVFFFLPYFAFMVIAPDPLAGMGPVTPANAQQTMDRMMEYYGQVWWAFLLIVILQAVGMLGLLALLTDHRRPTVAQALKVGLRKAWSYIAAYLLLGAATGLLLMLLMLLAALAGAAWLGVLAVLGAIAGWIFAFVRFSMVAPVLVKEDLGNPLAALGRSWRLTSGNGGRLFAFFFLLVIAFGVVVVVVSMVFGTILALFGTQVAQFGDALVVSLANATWVSLFFAVLSAIHDQLAGHSPAKLDQTFG